VFRTNYVVKGLLVIRFKEKGLIII
jgi:hypothetical protein